MTTTLVTDYLENIWERFATKTAFADDACEMSFRALRNEARAVATALSNLNIFRAPVCVYMPKRTQTIAAFLGAAYSGNFYTPIDTDMPASRANKILAKLEPAAIIADRARAEAVSNLNTGGAKILIYEKIVASATPDDDALAAIRAKLVDTDILYVFFTSGSTGEPKGVIIPHRAAIDFVEWFCDEFGIDENTFFGNQVPLFFDVSVQDIYATLKVGASAYLIDKKVFTFPAQAMKRMREKGVNTIVWVPSALVLVSNLKALQNRENLPDLRLVAFCGEVMPNKQLNEWRDTFKRAVFVNLYGPTETCDASAYFVVNRAFEPSEPLPIGFPCANTDIFLLDEAGKRVSEPNRLGELCVRGSSLAHGYWRDPERTAAAFTQNPLNHDYPERIYRTGDLCYYNERGELTYKSRKDYQIKRMGYRVELGEIEVAVGATKGVSECACVYENEKISCFFSGDASGEELARELKTRVPSYMIPDVFLPLGALPHNANGKIDRVALKNSLGEEK